MPTPKFGRVMHHAVWVLKHWRSCTNIITHLCTPSSLIPLALGRSLWQCTKRFAVQSYKHFPLSLLAVTDNSTCGVFSIHRRTVKCGDRRRSSNKLQYCRDMLPVQFNGIHNAYDRAQENTVVGGEKTAPDAQIPYFLNLKESCSWRSAHKAVGKKS